MRQNCMIPMRFARQGGVPGSTNVYAPMVISPTSQNVALVAFVPVNGETLVLYCVGCGFLST